MNIQILLALIVALHAPASAGVAPPAVAGTSAAANRAADGIVRDTTDSTFARDVLRPGAPAVVDFWARWCGPCWKLARPYKRLAPEYRGRVAFWKFNTGWRPEPYIEHQFKAVPTLIFYAHGREIARLEGAPDSTEVVLRRFLDAALRASR